MNMGNWALTLGIGAAAGAIGVMMLPKKSTARKMVDQAADNVEDMVDCATSSLHKKNRM